MEADSKDLELMCDALAMKPIQKGKLKRAIAKLKTHEALSTKVDQETPGLQAQQPRTQGTAAEKVAAPAPFAPPSFPRSIPCQSPVNVFLCPSILLIHASMHDSPACTHRE